MSCQFLVLVINSVIMIHKNIVFILGAGASIPYGYPSQDQLINEIKLLLGESGTVNQIVQDHNLYPVLLE